MEQSGIDIKDTYIIKLDNELLEIQPECRSANFAIILLTKQRAFDRM